MPGDVVGAFLVAPVGDTAITSEDAIDRQFMPVPREKLPFPAVLIASHDEDLVARSGMPVLHLEDGRIRRFGGVR